MDGLQDDTGDGSMICTEHPFKNNTPAGGICAFCLQEKLGKLVSSSFPIAVFPSSSSSSPSFRSDITTTSTTTTITSNVVPNYSMLGSNTNNTQINPNDCHYLNHHHHNNHHNHHSNRSRILYLLGQKKKKNIILDDGIHGTDRNMRKKDNLVLKRSKSHAAPRQGRTHYMNNEEDGLNALTTPNKRGFWSFLHLQKHPSQNSSQKPKPPLRDISSNTMCALKPPATPSFSNVQTSILVEENETPPHSTFDRKVSRSRSVGCGSRSFSGDFFERISTGLGDCTLRRVESHREGKPKPIIRTTNGHDSIQERARCGGLFSGFMMTSSSSSSSSSSNWVSGSNNVNQNEGGVVGKVTSAGQVTRQHNRSRSWGWALASPMRAFGKTTSAVTSASKMKKKEKPNLNGVPSLLSVGS